MSSYHRVVFALARRTVTVIDCHDEAGMSCAYEDLDPFQSQWWQLSLSEAATRLQDSAWNPRAAHR